MAAFVLILRKEIGTNALSQLYVKVCKRYPSKPTHFLSLESSCYLHYFVVLLERQRLKHNQPYRSLGQQVQALRYTAQSELFVVSNDRARGRT